MEANHTLKVLDDVITVKLNPKKNEIDQLSEIEIELIEEQLKAEFEKIQVALVNQVFETPKETKIRVIVNYYHDELITFINEVYKKRQYFPSSNRVLHHVYDFIISGLDDLISFIELRFSNYISQEKNAPVTYLIVAKDELKQKVESIKNHFLQVVPVRSYAELILKTIYKFIDARVEDGPVTFKEVLYMKELVYQLEFLEDPENPCCVYTALTELLVNLNFNNTDFVNFLTINVRAQISALPSLEEQYNELAFKRKEFSQMHEKPGIYYNPSLPGLKVQIDRWFTHELYFVEKKMKMPKTSEAPAPESIRKKKPEISKISVMLTGDQIGLVLRGLEQNRVIVAPTKKAVFEAVVPYLSSKERVDLSPGNTRSKSYEGTDHDKQVAVEMLEKLITTINDF